MTLILELPSLVLLGIAVTALIVALVAFPRKRQGLYRLDEVRYHDDVCMYYPMKRVSFGRWVPLEVEHGIRGYKAEEEARTALEDYLFTELDLEMSETTTLKEYG